MNRKFGYLSMTLSFLLCASACNRDHNVPVTGGHVLIPGEFWTPMSNPEPFADNFEARTKRPSEVFGQVLTVFKAPIRDDQKNGMKLSRNTWVEFMIVHPDQVTAQVRVDHGDYWTLSRQTFNKLPSLTTDISRYNPFPSPEVSRALYGSYMDEINRTRSVLASLTLHR